MSAACLEALHGRGARGAGALAPRQSGKAEMQFRALIKWSGRRALFVPLRLWPLHRPAWRRGAARAAARNPCTTRSLEKRIRYYSCALQAFLCRPRGVPPEGQTGQGVSSGVAPLPFCIQPHAHVPLPRAAAPHMAPGPRPRRARTCCARRGAGPRPHLDPETATPRGACPPRRPASPTPPRQPFVTVL